MIAGARAASAHHPVVSAAQRDFVGGGPGRMAAGFAGSRHEQHHPRRARYSSVLPPSHECALSPGPRAGHPALPLMHHCRRS